MLLLNNREIVMDLLIVGLLVLILLVFESWSQKSVRIKVLKYQKALKEAGDRRKPRGWGDIY